MVFVRLILAFLRFISAYFYKWNPAFSVIILDKKYIKALHNVNMLFGTVDNMFLIEIRLKKCQNVRIPNFYIHRCSFKELTCFFDTSTYILKWGIIIIVYFRFLVLVFFLFFIFSNWTIEYLNFGCLKNCFIDQR